MYVHSARRDILSLLRKRDNDPVLRQLASEHLAILSAQESHERSDLM